MTRISEVLEDFSSSRNAFPPQARTDEQIEGEKLASFENGYKAGWDDAVSAQASDTSRLSRDLVQNLQDLSFTYHEVRAKILEDLAPFFEEITAAFLPKLARQTLGPHIVDQLSMLVRDAAVGSVEIEVPPGSREAIATAIDTSGLSFPVIVNERSSLEDGQAEIRFGGQITQIDLSAVAEKIATDLNNALATNAKRVVND